MSIEQQLSDLTIAVRALTVAISTVAAGAALGGATAGEAGKPETEKKGPGRPKKEEATGKNAENPAGSTQSAGNASAGASSAAQTSTGSNPKTWNDVVAKVKELLASKEDGHGKPGVEKILAKFGLEGKKVPALEALGKHDEVYAAVEAALKGTAAEEGDDDILG